MFSGIRTWARTLLRKPLTSSEMSACVALAQASAELKRQESLEALERRLRAMSVDQLLEEYGPVSSINSSREVVEEYQRALIRAFALQAPDAAQAMKDLARAFESRSLHWDDRGSASSPVSSS